MTKPSRLFAALCSGTLALALSAGCSAAPMMSAPMTASGLQALKKKKEQPKPNGNKDLVFVTIKAKVVKILPDDTNGLPHQNFVVEELAPTEGEDLTVNNDTKFGSEVPNLKVGEVLTIRGVLYHNGGGNDGIHWTHHKDVPGDAGFIQTSDGHLYE
jgi:hypothetical protein